jgi:hypothetical protein
MKGGKPAHRKVRSTGAAPLQDKKCGISGNLRGREIVGCAVVEDMTAELESPSLDQHLVARVELAATGANVHQSRSLLCAYFGLCRLADEDPNFLPSLRDLEARLRVFCATGR